MRTPLLLSQKIKEEGSGRVCINVTDLFVAGRMTTSGALKATKGQLRDLKIYIHTYRSYVSVVRCQCLQDISLFPDKQQRCESQLVVLAD